MDLRGSIGRGLGYHDLLPHSVELQIEEGIRVRVLDLETLIVIKEELGGEKDRAVLPILRRRWKKRRNGRNRGGQAFRAPPRFVEMRRLKAAAG